MVQDVQIGQALSFILPRDAGEDQRWGFERSEAVERLEPKTSGGIVLKTFALIPYILLLQSLAFAQTPFYQGKTVTILHGRAPGGSGDFRVRAVIPFLQKYIPGNPAFVHEFMDGGGGRKAANHIFALPRTDGLVIGNVGGGVVANAVLGEQGVQYDLDKLPFI